MPTYPAKLPRLSISIMTVLVIFFYVCHKMLKITAWDNLFWFFQIDKEVAWSNLNTSVSVIPSKIKIKSKSIHQYTFRLVLSHQINKQMLTNEDYHKRKSEDGSITSSEFFLNKNQGKPFWFTKKLNIIFDCVYKCQILTPKNTKK